MEQLALQFLMGFAGVWGFAVLFRAPGIKCVYCGILGSLDWVFYLVIRSQGMPYAAAVALAVFVLALVSRAVAAWIRTPATVFVVTGIFPLVPGAGIYYAAYYFVTGDSVMAGQKASETVITALAIALGIVLANVFPQRWFNLIGRLRWKSGEKN